VAYQQGYAIARNLYSLALGYDPKPAHINLRGTLLKLGLDNGVANLFDTIELNGEVGHLIRQGTYLELLPTPIHDFKATTEWLKDEIFDLHARPGLHKTVRAVEIAGGVIAGALVARKLLKSLAEDGDR
jgi:NADH dehydrogenase